MRLRDRVGADAKKRYEEYRRSGRWLNRVIWFNHGLRLVNQDKKIKEIIETCKVSNREENRRNLEILIANLIHQDKKRPVVISMNKTEWKSPRYVRAGEGIIKLVKKLYEHGYIEMRKGSGDIQMDCQDVRGAGNVFQEYLY